MILQYLNKLVKCLYIYDKNAIITLNPISVLDGEATLEEALDKLKQHTRNYAKRQLTWFRKNKEIIWLNALDKIENNVNIILEGVKGE